MSLTLKTDAPARMTLVSPRSPARVSGDAGKLSPGSPLRASNDTKFQSATEYSETYKGIPVNIHNKSTNKRGNASHALWLPIGEDKYETETDAKFPGHQPPPAVARPVPKWEKSTLPFHGQTVYGESFPARTGGRPDIHKPRQQTATLPMPMQAKTEYSTSYTAEATSPTKPFEKVEYRAPTKPFYGLTQYGESFTGTGVRPADASATTDLSATADLSATSSTTGSSSAAGLGASVTIPKSPLQAKGAASTRGKFGASSLKAPERARIVTTTYGDLDGTGVDPWKLMKQLGYDVGARASSTRSVTSFK